MLAGIDTMVIDLQDVGARFYTYMTTMAYVMEEAARRRIAVVVLDRPNPIDGYQIEGPTLDASQLGFTGYFPMPIRHGMTLGELARLFNGGEQDRRGPHRRRRCRTGTAKAGSTRPGSPWINPSPNMRNLLQATLYPGYRRDRGHERIGRPRHRHAVRAGRRAVDRRRRRWPMR